MTKEKEYLDISKIEDIKNLTPEESAKIRDRDIKIPLTPLFCILTVLASVVLSSGIFLLKRDMVYSVQAFCIIMLLIYVSAVDIKLHMAPNWIAGAIGILGIPSIVISLINSNYYDLLFNRLTGIFGGFLLLFVAAIASKGGVGAADIKITAALGLFMGLEGIFTGQLIGLFFAAIVSVILLIVRKVDKKTRIPLLPFISAGVTAAMFLPNNILF